MFFLQIKLNNSFYFDYVYVPTLFGSFSVRESTFVSFDLNSNPIIIKFLKCLILYTSANFQIR